MEVNWSWVNVIRAWARDIYSVDKDDRAKDRTRSIIYIVINLAVVFDIFRSSLNMAHRWTPTEAPGYVECPD
ncbi:hypothetical protein HZ326_15193 [Fusarium oxysporum f. sp. albedinis]|nr:hypothetical protein HZ326_15193 [Fusarium oxysporum f. sp. albedinis]